MSFVDQTLSNDVFISIVRPSQQKLVTQLTKRTVVAPTGTHDQVLSDDLCVRLCRYCLGTHSGQLRQSLNCANGPYNPSVAEAGTRSQVVHAGGIEEFGIRVSEVVTAAAPWGFDCESNEKEQRPAIQVHKKGGAAVLCRNPENSPTERHLIVASPVVPRSGTPMGWTVPSRPYGPQKPSPMTTGTSSGPAKEPILPKLEKNNTAAKEPILPRLFKDSGSVSMPIPPEYW